jgi:hypothetical protein
MTKGSDQLETVNRSGYPLQVAIAHAVKSRTNVHGWRVLYEEHSWKSNEGDGFIDIVLEHENLQVVLLIECKRLQNKEWILLPPDGDAKLRRHARGLRVERTNGGVKPHFPMWHDEPCDPRTPEAMFCVMPKDARDPAVERVGAELISAAEALEFEERPYLDRRGGDSRRIYFSAIVTTAQLTVCSFDQSSVSLSDGTIPTGAKFESVDAVRLTKQLSTQPIKGVPVALYGDEAQTLIKAKERTIFVVNALKLDEFLYDFNVDDRDKDG